MILPRLETLDAALTRLADRRPVWPMILLAVFAVLLFLPGFFSLPPVDRDESRYAQATKQMVASGDYIDIRLGEGTRYKKPVGIYWMQSIPAAVAGPEMAREIWVYRLPALVSAVAATLLTYLVALSLAGQRVALLAGGLMAVTLVLGAEARQAKTDAALLASILTAQWMLARLWMRGAEALRGAWPWVFWVALGASVLIKGPIGLMVVGFTIAGLSIVARDLRWLAPLRPARGALVFLVVVLPWYILITWKTGSAFWAESLGRDMLGKVAQGQENHGAPPGYYLGLMWVTFWPAALLLPFAVAQGWREWRDRGVQFALIWVIPTWVVFEVVATKLPHYTLPVYPALAILTAGGWLGREGARLEGKRGLAHWVLVSLLLAVGAALAVVFVVLPFLRVGVWPSLDWLLGAALLAGGFATVWVAMRHCLGFAPLLGMGAMSAGLAFAFWGHWSHVDFLWPAKSLAAIEAEQDMCDGAALISTGFEEPSLMVLSQRLPALVGPQEAAARTRAADCALVYVEAARQEAYLEALGDARGPLPEPIAVIEAMNLGSGREQQIAVYRFD